MRIKYLSAIFLLIMLMTACSQKQSKQESSKQERKEPPEQISQQNQTPSSPGSFAVKSIGNVTASNQMVDFSWMENQKEVKLSDFKGKVILLNFWATWCPPCRKELPDLSQISEELKDKDFVMIGISVDDNQSVLDNFLKNNRLPYKIVFEPTELVMKYMESAGQRQNVVPQTYIIDKNGKIVETILGARSKKDFLNLINKYL